ncbi:hypothetical protein JOD02_001233 [Caldicoprobacter guelmensis]|uniref:hypothetical protein n=1 Tax=Caldicoprobacter guelmensis TaxID=1170224 RepID=UPI00195AFAD3|nr:hypothetical protein [Caldicoprobacter guelmensis]MBM7582376.1 hypothetical protein [Caldicoprobacter guelmensis]
MENCFQNHLEMVYLYLQNDIPVNVWIILRLHINWDNIEFDSSEREKQIISCSQALDKVISYLKAAKNIDYNKEMTITNVALVYSNSFGVYVQIKENGEVVNEFRITGPSYLDEDEYIALTTEGINVNIPAFIGTKLESELRKNNYSLSYGN